MKQTPSFTSLRGSPARLCAQTRAGFVSSVYVVGLRADARRGQGCVCVCVCVRCVELEHRGCVRLRACCAQTTTNRSRLEQSEIQTPLLVFTSLHGSPARLCAQTRASFVSSMCVVGLRADACRHRTGFKCVCVCVIIGVCVCGRCVVKSEHGGCARLRACCALTTTNTIKLLQSKIQTLAFTSLHWSPARLCAQTRAGFVSSVYVVGLRADARRGQAGNSD